MALVRPGHHDAVAAATVTEVDRRADPSPPGSRDLTLDLCACAQGAGPRVAAALLACDGVLGAHVDPYVTWALTTFDPARTTPDAIVEQLSAAGFEVRATRLFDPGEPVQPFEPVQEPT